MRKSILSTLALFVFTSGSLLAAPAEKAHISIKPTKNIQVGVLETGSKLHGNRKYTYTKVADKFKKNQYILHSHKAPSDMKISVKQSGTLYLALSMGAKPDKAGLDGSWKATGDTLATSVEKKNHFAVFSKEVKQGESFDVKSVNRWGSVLLAEKIVVDGKPRDLVKNGRTTFDLANAFDRLRKEIADSKKWNMKRLNNEVLRKDALILDSDKTPVDIILRRTKALLENIKTLKNAPSLSEEKEQLNALATDNTSDLSEELQRNLFDKVKKLRRTIAFKNPLLDFDKILFIKHDRMVRGEKHMVDQYLGFNMSKNGGVYVLENPFSDEPSVKSLLSESKVQNGRLKDKILEDNGSFISLELDYDADQIYFAYTEALNEPYKPKGKDIDPVVA